MSEGFRYEFRVGLAEVDGHGRLHPHRLLARAHEAYEAMMAERGLGLPRLLREGLALPLVHTQARCLAPMEHGGRIVVRPRITGIGKGSFRLRCTFLSPQGEPLARVVTVHACVHGAHPVPLPPWLRQRLAGEP